MTTITVKMLWFECGVCGVPFGMSEAFRDAAKRDGTSFKCVRGCGLRFGESEADSLRRELDAKNTQLLRREAELRNANERARRFKCPYCPKTYVNAQGLQRHERDVHQSPLRLAKDAGPSAFNTKVS